MPIAIQIVVLVEVPGADEFLKRDTICQLPFRTDL
jgi:hypothetical protein